MDNDYRNDNIYEGEPVYGSGGPSPQRDGNRKKSVFIAVGLVLAMLMGFLGSVIGNAITGNGHTTMLEGNRPSSVIDLATVDTSKLMTARSPWYLPWLAKQ